MQLLEYLSLLSPPETSSFSKFVASPYFNTNAKSSRFLTYLLREHRETDKPFSRQAAFRYLYPRQTYDEQLLYNQISYLLRLYRRFLVQQKMDTVTNDHHLHLMEAAFERGSEKLFRWGSKRSLKQRTASERDDGRAHYQQYRYQQLLDDFDLRFGKRDSGRHLEKATVYFDNYLLGEKLKLSCQLLARKQVTGQAYEAALSTEIVNYLDQNTAHYQNIPSVWNYFLIYRLMTTSEPTYFFQLKTQLDKSIHCFNHREGRDLFTAALNYCIGRINLGEEKYRQETFNLYQRMLSVGLLYERDILPHWDYTNIVSLACYLKEFAWAAEFIESQRAFLPVAEQGNAHAYNLAALYYHQADYAAALPVLNQVGFSDTYYSLLTRLLLLKIFYDSAQWQALENTLDTFRLFLLRHKNIDPQRRKSSNNLLRFTRKLLRIRREEKLMGKSEVRKRLHKLEIDLLAKNAVLNREWLQERIALAKSQ